MKIVSISNLPSPTNSTSPNPPDLFYNPNLQPPDPDKDRVAILIVNYNMPERSDGLVEAIQNRVKWPHDLILIDNGSDIQKPSIHTSLQLAQNIQTTGGWLMGLHYADSLAQKRGFPYFAYWFIITSAEFPDGENDPLSPLAGILATDPNAVAVHPALSSDSTTVWQHLIQQGSKGPRQTWMIDNIASLYRADWFDRIGRFDPQLFMAHGIDLETCWKARREGRSIWVQEDSIIKKITNIGYALNRMNMEADERVRFARENMDQVLAKRYGPDYWNFLIHDSPIDTADQKPLPPSLTVDHKNPLPQNKNVPSPDQSGLKVLLVSNGYPPEGTGGVEVYTRLLASQLQVLGHEVRVIFPQWDINLPLGQIIDTVRDDIQISILNLHRSTNIVEQFDNPQIGKFFADFLAEHSFDLVHFQHLVGFTATALEECKKAGVRSVMTIHDGWFLCEQIHFLQSGKELCPGPDSIDRCVNCYIKRESSRFLDDRIAEISPMFSWRKEYLQHTFSLLDAVFIPSKYLFHRFEQFGFHHSNNIHFPIGIQAFEPKPHTPESNTVRFAFLGNMYATKGVDLLIDAFLSLDSQDAQLDLYGSVVDPDYFNRHTQKISQDSRVKYHGPYDPGQLSEILSGIDVVVLPSRSENYPTVIREALHAGIPVIGPNLGGVPEIIEHQTNGLLFIPENSEDLAQKMAAFIQDRSLISNLKKGIKPVRTVAEDARDYSQHYSRILNSEHTRVASQQTPENQSNVREWLRQVGDDVTRNKFGTVKFYQPGQGDYSEARTVHANVPHRKWSHVCFQIDLSENPIVHALRVNIMDQPAIIEVGFIRVTSGDITIWELNAASYRNDLKVKGTAKIIHRDHKITILSFGNDPQIYIPELPLQAFDTSRLQLELHIRAEILPAVLEQHSLEIIHNQVTEIDKRITQLGQSIQPAGLEGNGFSTLIRKLDINPRQAQDLIRIFDSAYYLANNPVIDPRGYAPLYHYISHGVTNRQNPSTWFDTHYYLESYPEVALTGENPLLHFVVKGEPKGYNPSPLFDTNYYKDTNPDVAASHINALRHYLEFGISEGRQPHPSLSAEGEDETLEDQTGFLHRIESCFSHENQIIVQGWAFSKGQSLKSVSMLIDHGSGRERFDGHCGQIRADVANSYPYPNAMRSGFMVEGVSTQPDQAKFLLEFSFSDGQSVLIPFHLPPPDTSSPVSTQAPDTWAIQGKAIRKNYLGDILELFQDEAIIPENLGQEIDIIIPVYKGLEYLPRLFDSIYRNTTEPYRLILVDDGNQDDRILNILQEVIRHRPNSVLIQHPRNLGFVASCNDGYAQTRNHFVLLNTDVEVPPFWLERLVGPILKQEHIASTTPFTNSGTICSFPKFLENNDLFIDAQVEEIDEVFRHVNTEQILIPMPTGVGFCMGINKQVCEEIGFFDADTFGAGYAEENDWCSRAIKKGYQNILVPNLFVWHKHGGSFEKKEKTELMARNHELLAQKHPTYFSDTLKFIEIDPAGPIRDLIIMNASSRLSSQKPLLIIDHELGGGTTHYRKDLVKKRAENNLPTLVLSWNYLDHMYTLVYTFGKLSINFQEDSLHHLDRLWEMISPGEILVNSIVSFPDPSLVIDLVIDLHRARQIPISTAMHDFYPVCPSYNLINADGITCGIPGLDTCRKCLPNNSFSSSPFTTSIDTWREKWGTLFQNSEKVLYFSSNTEKLTCKAYPASKSKSVVRPHQVNYLPSQIPQINFDQGLHIGVIGALSYVKGSQVVTEMVDLLKERNLPIQLTVIGSIDIQQSQSVRYTGPYKRPELPMIIESLGTNVFFFPSIWPETFSFVIEEMMRMHLPICCFDLGAPADRVRHYYLGKIISRISAKTAMDEISHFYSRLRDRSIVRKPR